MKKKKSNLRPKVKASLVAMRRRKGGWRWGLLLLLLWTEGVFCDPKVVDHCQKYLFIGFEGKRTVLQPVVNGTPTDITWKKEENIVHEWDGKDDSNGSLIIRNTSHSDAGFYTAEALVEHEIQYTYYCLKVLDYLRPPDLICSVHNDNIQVNCTVPPEITSQNLPVSYLWKEKGWSIHNESSIQLQRNTDQPEEITCIVSIANVNASNSINLSGCILQAQQAEPQTQTALIVLAVILVVLLVIGLLWKKGCFRKCQGCFRKCQEHPAVPEGSPLEPKQNCNESEGLLGNLEEKRSESKEFGVGDALRNQKPSPEKGLPLSRSKPDSDSAKNLEESEGGAEDGFLEEIQHFNHSRCVSENMEEKKKEDVLEDQESPLKEEGVIGPKPD